MFARTFIYLWRIAQLCGVMYFDANAYVVNQWTKSSRKHPFQSLLLRFYSIVPFAVTLFILSRTLLDFINQEWRITRELSINAVCILWAKLALMGGCCMLRFQRNILKVSGAIGHNASDCKRKSNIKLFCSLRRRYRGQDPLPTSQKSLLWCCDCHIQCIDGVDSLLDGDYGSGAALCA